MHRPLPTTLLTCALALGGVVAPLGSHTAATRAQQKKTAPKAAWVDPDKGEPSGTRYRTFASTVLGADVSYLVYLPPGYEKETKRYPVVYWLHGLGGNQRGGATVFVPHVDAAVRKGVLPPAVVVCVNGMVNSFYCDWADGKLPIESVIVKDLVPHIDKEYRTVARREGRVVQGFSMGGFGAAHLGFKYPELFGAVCIDAGALLRENALNGPVLTPVFKGDRDRFLAEHPLQLVEKNVAKVRGRTTIRVGVGGDDSLLPRNKELHDLLEKLKVEHRYEVVAGVGHNSRDYYEKLGPKCLEVHRAVFEALDPQK
jgi:endo-1,4-beta-xylanase